MCRRTGDEPTGQVFVRRQELLNLRNAGFVLVKSWRAKIRSTETKQQAMSSLDGRREGEGEGREGERDSKAHIHWLWLKRGVGGDGR